jgi:hypothetical protein
MGAPSVLETELSRHVSTYKPKAYSAVRYLQQELHRCTASMHGCEAFVVSLTLVPDICPLACLQREVQYRYIQANGGAIAWVSAVISGSLGGCPGGVS